MYTKAQVIYTLQNWRKIKDGEQACLDIVKKVIYVGDRNPPLKYLRHQNKLQNREEICFEAVKTNMYNINYITHQKTLKNYTDLWLYVIEKHGYFWKTCIPKYIKNYPELCLKAIMKDIDIFDDIHPLEKCHPWYKGYYICKRIETFPNSDLIFTELVSRRPRIIEYIPSSVPEYYKYCSIAVKRGYEYIQYCGDKYPDLCLEAVKLDPQAIRWFQNHSIIPNYPEVCLEAVKKAGRIIECIQNLEELPNRLEICKIAVDKHPSNITECCDDFKPSFEAACKIADYNGLGADFSGYYLKYIKPENYTENEYYLICKSAFYFGDKEATTEYVDSNYLTKEHYEALMAYIEGRGEK